MASGWREPTGMRFCRSVDTGPLAKLEVLCFAATSLHRSTIGIDFPNNPNIAVCHGISHLDLKHGTEL
jgi:hypothetical protein